MTRLRIVIPIHSFDPGGVERVALRLARQWQDDGAEVTVLLGRNEGPPSAVVPGLNYASYSSGPIRTKAVETLWMIVCLWRWLRSNRADILFCAGNTYSVVTTVMRLLLGSNCPAIVSKVSNTLRRSDMPPVMRAFYRLWLRIQRDRADAWVAMAESLRPEIAEVMALPPSRLTVVDDPALSASDLRRYAAIDRSDRRPQGARRFIAVGRLVRQKRVDRLIRAFARGAAAGDRLIVLGEGPLRGRLEALARRLGVAAQIEFVGHCDRVDEWLARADVFVLASDYEGLPAVAVEALAAGLPILATRCSDAMAELTGNGRFGWLVERDDETALAAAIRTAAPDAHQIAEARALAARFCVERSGPQYLRLMERTIERRDAGRAELDRGDRRGAGDLAIGTVSVARRRQSSRQ